MSLFYEIIINHYEIELLISLKYEEVFLQKEIFKIIWNIYSLFPDFFDHFQY